MSELGHIPVVEIEPGDGNDEASKDFLFRNPEVRVKKTTRSSFSFLSDERLPIIMRA
jgi:hypothetical protein